MVDIRVELVPAVVEEGELLGDALRAAVLPAGAFARIAWDSSSAPSASSR